MTNTWSNQEWKEMLCNADIDRQAEAWQALGHYLFILGSRYLTDREAHLPNFANLASSEIEQFAQDAVQNTLIKIWNIVCQTKTFEDKAKLTTFAATILFNEIKQRLRKDQKQVSIASISDDEEGNEHFINSGAAQNQGNTHTLEEDTILGEAFNEIQRISGQSLTERRRVAFWLRHWLGLSVKVIAETMTLMHGKKITADMVSGYIFQARRQYIEELRRVGLDQIFSKEN